MSKLTYVQRLKIVIFSLTYLNKKRTKDFKCCTFVKDVYRKSCVSELDSPIKNEFRDNFPFGYSILLKEKKSKKKSEWSHIVISLPFGFVIHNSIYFGKKVSITPMSKIRERYKIV